MVRRICVASQKGGVGKTTILLNLAVAFAERGRRTLLADLDPQGGIGHSLAQGDTALVGLADFLMGEVGADRALLSTKLPTLTLLPRGRLDPVDACDFEQALHSPGVLDSALERLESGFDVVLLDTPSGLGPVTRGALAASQFVLIPFQVEPLVLRTVGQVLRVIQHVRDRENPALQLLGILPTMVEKSKDVPLSVLGEIWSGFSGVLETVIPRHDAFLTASRQGLPVSFMPGKTSPEARRFDLLVTELEFAMEQLSQGEVRGDERPGRELL